MYAQITYGACFIFLASKVDIQKWLTLIRFFKTKRISSVYRDSIKHFFFPTVV